jgi:hypothetical protein
MSLRARLAGLQRVLDEPAPGEQRMGPLEMLILASCGRLILEPPFSRELQQLDDLIARSVYEPA